MLDQASPAPEVQMFALVRDKDGRPKIDNPATLHPAIKAMLTPEERAEFGVTWSDADEAVADSMQRLNEKDLTHGDYPHD